MGTAEAHSWENAFIQSQWFNGELEISGTVEDGSGNPLQRRMLLLANGLNVIAGMDSSPVDGSYAFENLREQGDQFVVLKLRTDTPGYAQARDQLIPV